MRNRPEHIPKPVEIRNRSGSNPKSIRNQSDIDQTSELNEVAQKSTKSVGNQSDINQTSIRNKGNDTDSNCITQKAFRINQTSDQTETCQNQSAKKEMTE